MADESRNSKVSVRVAERTPQWVRDNKPLYVALMEAYYEYLEQSTAGLSDGRVVQRAKNLRNYMDPDYTLDGFLNHFYNQFMKLIPRDTQVDTRLLMKHIKDFYRAKGSEKSFKFLIRLLSTGTNEAEFYYPKQDILRASHSTWYIQKTLRLLDITYDGVTIDETVLSRFYLFEGNKVYGVTSGAHAVVDRADHFYDQGIVTDELTLSSISGTFIPGEEITCDFTDDDGVAHQLMGTINPGVVTQITVRERGSNYTVGSDVPIESRNGLGSGAIARIASVTGGSVEAANVYYGGSGFQANDMLSIFADEGSGASGYLLAVNPDGLVHPNSYIIDSSTISLEANTTIGNASYTNLVSANANTAIGNSVPTFVFGNTGPALYVTITASGSGYTSAPVMSAVGNTRVQALGILGRLTIANRGRGYAANDVITFNNVMGGHGTGAAAKVLDVNANGSIMNVTYTTVTGFPKGGLGYENAYLPTVNIASTGNGAIIMVGEILGTNSSIQPVLSTIGGILSIELLQGGSGYNVAPIINLTALGDGTANAYANVILGLFQYPGRYLDDTGILSAFNFLEDRDYYQNFSYVVRVDESLARYRNALLKLVHPAGTMLFAEYMLIEDDVDFETAISNNQITTPSFFDPASIHYDGNTSMETLAALGMSSMNVGTLSVWVKPSSLPQNSAAITDIFSIGLSNTRSHLYFENASSSNSATGQRLVLSLASGQRPDLNAVVMMSDANGSPLWSNEWFHVLMSWDVANVSKCHLWVSNANVIMSRTVLTSNSVNTTAKPFVVGGGKSTTSAYDFFFSGGMAQFFLSNSYIDISQNSNRKLFANNFQPQNLVSTLLSNASVVPLVLLRSNVSFANVNYVSTMNSFSVLHGTFTTESDTPAT